MTQMFERHALLSTVKEGKKCSYGVRGGSVRFGYIPSKEEGRDQPISNVQEELKSALATVGVDLDIIRRVAPHVVDDAQGFTLVSGFGPKGYNGRIPVARLVDTLRSHAQMIQTLQVCKVFIISNGALFNDGQSLELPVIVPMPGAENPRQVPVPEILTDPESNEAVSTTAGMLPAGELVLRTSDASMRNPDRRSRHNIVFRAESGYIGVEAVSELDVQSPYRDRIYGECVLLSVEPYKQNDRRRLAESPLTRALIAWIGERVEEYARQFEAEDRRRHSQDERNALSRMNEALDRWKNQFLRTVLSGLWGDDTIGPPPPPPPLPRGIPARIDLEMPYHVAGVGVSFRPTLKFFDRDDQRIRATPYRWLSDDNNVAMVDDDALLLRTFAFGKTQITAETLDGRVRSNSAPLEVVHLHAIEISPSQLEVAAGGRARFQATCRLESGEERSDLLLIWTEGDSSIARVSSSGLVFGSNVGQTDIWAGDDRCLSGAATVRVVPGEGPGGGGNRGRGYPKVLISEIDPDPETGESVNFSPDDPPVAQRPQDVENNVWWINSSAPLARLNLERYGHASREWRMYHLERYMDVMVQISMTYGPTESLEMSAADWIQKWGERVAELQRHMAVSLADFIGYGFLPGE
jgi:hypothetical protein